MCGCLARHSGDNPDMVSERLLLVLDGVISPSPYLVGRLLYCVNVLIGLNWANLTVCQTGFVVLPCGKGLVGFEIFEIGRAHV